LTLRPLTEVTADRGDTVKYLVNLADGATVETVFMRYEDGRRSVCISTQVGCGMGCTFCATGLAGLTRNLTAAEIIDQVLLVQRKQQERITNVVFMGMGEPLLNWEAVDAALTILNHPDGCAIGARHITLSTVGILPNLARFGARPEQFRLAISLHAPTPELRRALMPIEKKYHLDEVLDALRQPLEHGEVVIARSGGVTRFPARFQLVLAANPCPCARPSGNEACSCSPVVKRPTGWSSWTMTFCPAHPLTVPARPCR